MSRKGPLLPTYGLLNKFAYQSPAWRLHQDSTGSGKGFPYQGSRRMGYFERKKFELESEHLFRRPNRPFLRYRCNWINRANAQGPKPYRRKR